METRVVNVEELPELLQDEDTNRWTTQIFYASTGWVDYASIKTQTDLDLARKLVNTQGNRYRIFGRI